MAEETKHDILLKRINITLAIVGAAIGIIVGVYNLRKVTKPEPPPPPPTRQAPAANSEIKSALEEAGASLDTETGQGQRLNMETPVQPLDTLMTRLGLSNADLVKASTEQLSFKMVQKGRQGRYQSLNIQEKIFNALLKLKPELKIKRRELFHYPLPETVIDKIVEASSQLESKRIDYPKFVDLLIEAGINHYSVDTATDKITFYGAGGDAHVSTSSVIRHAVSGNVPYDVNLRQRKILFKGEAEVLREKIPVAGAAPVMVKPAAVKKKPAAKKKPIAVSKTRKARLALRKRYFNKKKRARRPS